MSLYKGSTLIAGGSQQTPLLSFVWADHLLSDISWLRADTFSWQAGSVYTAVYSHLTSDITGKTLQSETIGGTTIQFYLADDGHKICPASEESNVIAIYSATGVAWYYILDTENTRFKLPRSKHEHYGNRPVIGNQMTLGLTDGTNNAGLQMGNHTSGTYHQNQLTVAVSKYDTSVGTTFDSSSLGTEKTLGITTDPTKSGMISTPVQDTDQYKYLYFYVGQFTQTAIQQTAGLNAELFNGKADINTVVLKGHEVIEFQAPTADNNYTWYRKYADGWVEQGGHKIFASPSSSGTLDISLPVSMNDTYFTSSCTGYSNGTLSWVAEISSGRTTSSVKFGWNYYNGQTTFNGFDWQVSGMYEQ